MAELACGRYRLIAARRVCSRERPRFDSYPQQQMRAVSRYFPAAVAGWTQTCWISAARSVLCIQRQHCMSSNYVVFAVRWLAWLRCLRIMFLEVVGSLACGWACRYDRPGCVCVWPLVSASDLRAGVLPVARSSNWWYVGREFWEQFCSLIVNKLRLAYSVTMLTVPQTVIMCADSSVIGHSLTVLLLIFCPAAVCCRHHSAARARHRFQRTVSFTGAFTVCTLNRHISHRPVLWPFRHWLNRFMNNCKFLYVRII